MKYAILLSIMCGLLGCFTGPDKRITPPPRPAEPISWERDAVILHTRGYVLSGGQQRPASWKSAGVFVTHDLIATRATHALRATQMTATTSAGKSYEVHEVAALDLELDIALLRTKTRRPGPERIRIRTHPGDLRDLRRLAIDTVGLTSDQLSSFPGRIINVTQEPEMLYHDGHVPKDLDNGPVLGSEDGALLGLQRRVQPRFRFSQVIPVWSLEALIQKSQRGHSLTQTFTLPDEPQLRNAISQEVCLPTGEAQEVVAPFSLGEDIMVRVTPRNGQKVFYELALLTSRGSAPLEEGLIAATTERVFTAPLEARYRVTLASPSDAQETSCAHLEVGAIDWATQLAPKEKSP